MPGISATKLVLHTLRSTAISSICRKALPNVGSILMLHRVEAENTKPKKFAPNAHLAISAEFLDEMLLELSKQDYDFVSLDEAKNRIQSQQNQRRFIAVTLDDGYTDNLENAVPIFEKYNVPYTIFIAPGLVDGRATLWWEDLEHIIAENRSVTVEFNDQPKSFTSDTLTEKNKAFGDILNLLTTEVSEEAQREIMKSLCNFYGIDAETHRANAIMDWERLLTLEKTELCTLGAHTLHHYAVARMRKDQCRYELDQSAIELEKKLGERPKHLAYPYGYPAAAASRDFEIAKECGFETAVTTRHGICTKSHSSHLTALPRISVNGHFQDMDCINVLLSGAPTLLQNKGRMLNVE